MFPAFKQLSRLRIPCHRPSPLKWRINGHMAVGQNQWYHFGVGVPPILVYFSGDWDVHWGYDWGFDPQPYGWKPTSGRVSSGSGRCSSLLRCDAAVWTLCLGHVRSAAGRLGTPFEKFKHSIHLSAGNPSSSDRSPSPPKFPPTVSLKRTWFSQWFDLGSGFGRI